MDDEPNVRFVFRTALESAGFTVDEAEDGRVALDRLGATSPDVVLLDLQMPNGPGGMEVLRRLRDGGNDVPVVVVTAHGSVPDAVAAMKLGAIDFLPKPMTPEVLRRVVTEVIKRHAQAAPTPDPELAVVASSPKPVVVTVGPTLLDLSPAKQALNLRDFDRAATLLESALDNCPDSVEALNLMGVLQESRGQDHGAYHAYKAALTADPTYTPAHENMRRYCERFGLDAGNHAINPAAAE